MSEDKRGKPILPFKLSVDQFIINDGNADLRVFTEKDSIKIKTLFNLELTNLQGDENDSSNVWLEKLGWKVILSKSKVETGRIRIAFKTLLLDELNSQLLLKGLSFQHDKKLREKESALEITELSIPVIELRDMKYDHFIFRDTLTFSKILIDKPIFSAVIHPVPETETKEITTPDLSFLDKINYDNIEMRNLKFNLENLGNNIKPFYKKLCQ